MTGLNHAITGAVIAAALPNPLISLPLAFLSHFALDALPHFGNHSVAKWGTTEHRAIVIGDTLLTILFLVIVVLFTTPNWGVLVLGGILAISPDIIWLPHYVDANRHVEPKPYNKIAQLHKAIQWGERPWGMRVELAWLILMSLLFYNLAIK